MRCVKDAFEGWPVLGSLPGWAQAVLAFPVCLVILIAFWGVLIGGVGMIEAAFGGTAAGVIVIGGFLFLMGRHSR